jgi:hypothetical protein
LFELWGGGGGGGGGGEKRGRQSRKKEEEEEEEEKTRPGLLDDSFRLYNDFVTVRLLFSFSFIYFFNVSLCCAVSILFGNLTWRFKLKREEK